MSLAYVAARNTPIFFCYRTMSIVVLRSFINNVEEIWVKFNANFCLSYRLYKYSQFYDLQIFVVCPANLLSLSLSL